MSRKPPHPNTIPDVILHTVGEGRDASLLAWRGFWCVTGEDGAGGRARDVGVAP